MRFYTNVSRYGNQLLYRGYENGRRVQSKVKYKPTLFVSTSKESSWKSIDGVPVAPVKFDSMRDAKEWITINSDVAGRKIFGNTKYHYAFINEHFPLNIQFDYSKIHIANIDIEVDSSNGFPLPAYANSEVTSICIKNVNESTYYVWSTAKWDARACEIIKENPDIKVEYIHSANEVELLLAFLNYWESNCPDVVTGYNTEYFDMPYLANRINKIFGEDQLRRLSPWKNVNMSEKEFNGRKNPVVYIDGVSSLDFLKVFQKFGYTYGPQESYKLDHIAEVILGEKKLDYDGSLYDLYQTNPQRFVSYNIKDVLLVDRMIHHTGLIELAITIAYKAGVNFEDTFGTTSIWDSIITRNLWVENKVVPMASNNTKTDFPGAYVKAPIVGMHEYVASFDLNSLYPSIIMQWNMSPETILNETNPTYTVDKILNNPAIVNNKGKAVSAHGQYFRTDEIGILPKIIDGMYTERVEVKQKMIKTKKELESNSEKAHDLNRKIAQFDNQQMAIKILLNSLYGAMGNRWFKFFDQRIAESITLSGQLVIQWAEKTINTYLNKILKTKDIDFVIAIDTDSVYINLSKLVERVNPQNPIDFIDAVCKEKLEPIISESYDELFKIMGGVSNRMVMKREVLADRAIWTAKKRYILNVHDNEGVRYTEPKLKIMGIEAVKSSTPMVCRNALKSIFKSIMTKTEAEVQKEISDFKTTFMSCQPHEVAFPRGVNEVDKYVSNNEIIKGAPINSRAAILYNIRLTELNLGKKYDKIKNGDKIKFVYMRLPNPIRQNVFGFPEYLPKEMQLDKYVDYEMQFEKTFLNVIDPILEIIGWSVEEVYSIEDFFG